MIFKPFYLSVIPAVQRLSHLAIFVDSSHANGLIVALASHSSAKAFL
jgi:3-deoxy-D-arabino-heptulosonate 7-phosphate (DAHP) synthase